MNKIPEEDYEWEDLMTNGTVLKRIIRHGHGNIPEYRQFVSIHLLGKDTETNKIIKDTNEEGDPIEFPIGDMILNLVDYGVMLACKSMKVGEIAVVRVNSRFTFIGKDIEYQVELIKVNGYEKNAIELVEADEEEQVKYIDRYKNRGNYFFNIDDFERAEKCYQHAIKLGESCSVNSELISQVLIKSSSNLAATYEKQDKNNQALEICTQVLQKDEYNLKNLLRICRITIEQGKFQEAELAKNKALEKYPNNPHVKRIVEKLSSAISSYKKKEKAIYTGFLSKPVNHTPRKSNEKSESSETLQKNGSEKKNKHFSTNWIFFACTFIIPIILSGLLYHYRDKLQYQLNINI